MIYARPNTEGSLVQFRSRYDNYIGGQWVAPKRGQYFEDISPVTGRAFCEVARSTHEDVDLALDAAHAAKESWGRTSVTERARILNQIADRIEQNLERLAVAETWDNGKAVRETLAADLPLNHPSRRAAGPGCRSARTRCRPARRSRARGRAAPWCATPCRRCGSGPCSAAPRGWSPGW